MTVATRDNRSRSMTTSSRKVVVAGMWARESVARRHPGKRRRETRGKHDLVLLRDKHDVLAVAPKSQRAGSEDDDEEVAPSPARWTMADFDAIYEEEEENEQNLEEHYVAMVPDPIVIRGAGNMTV